MKASERKQLLDAVEAIKEAIRQCSGSAKVEIVVSCPPQEIAPPATFGWMLWARGPTTTYTITITDRAAAERSAAEVLREANTGGALKMKAAAKKI